MEIASFFGDLSHNDVLLKQTQVEECVFCLLRQTREGNVLFRRGINTTLFQWELEHWFALLRLPR